MAFKLVIFDFDGTLANSEAWFVSVLNQVAAKFRFKQVDDAEIAMLRGHGTRDVLAYLGIPMWKLPFIARHLRKMAARETERTLLFAGIDAMFEALESAGIRIALVTSNSEKVVRTVLGTHAARVVCFEGGSSLFGKAAKFRRVLKRLKVAPHEAIAIGDETRDVEAARTVGMHAAGVLWGYANRGTMEAAGADALFHTPQEIISFVLGLDH